uniref:Uncharacterized protein n=1 Tax=Knipowitschia caucasica TaxID=637954 RepID=A0AAV2JF47_KNICA
MSRIRVKEEPPVYGPSSQECPRFVFRGTWTFIAGITAAGFTAAGFTASGITDAVRNEWEREEGDFTGDITGDISGDISGDFTGDD